MRFVRAQIKNYKSFNSSDEILFTPGFNVIVGRNNSGKTALVEALSLNYSLYPHRSLISPQKSATSSKEFSEVLFEIKLSKEAFFSVMPEENIRFKVNPLDDFPIKISLMVHRDLINLNYRHLVREKAGREEIISGYFLALGNIANNSNSYLIRFIEEQAELSPKGAGTNDERDIIRIIFDKFKSLVYMFDARRYNKNSCLIEGKLNLKSDISNLPSVLHYLRTQETYLFKIYLDAIQSIFPDITDIILPTTDGEATIHVSYLDPALQRGDLSVPLSQCGTGVSQVLAIFAIVITAKEPKVIIIDEPQTFLHPGAVRTLFTILKYQSIEHQYIITTHSPDAILSANPQNIIQVEKNGFESTVRNIDLANAGDIRTFMFDLGVRLSDVFGADNILWVEGATEEACFPLVVEKILKKPLFGTAIISVIQTGDFENKRAKTVFEIYQRLSEVKGIVPSALGFMFDRESKSDAEIEDLERQSSGRVHFLNRRLYENYLLNPAAITAVINEDPEFGNVGVTEEQINQWLDDNLKQSKYFKPYSTPKASTLTEPTLKIVHGAKVLHDIYAHFSKETVEYRKTVHTLALTKWIIKNSPEDLREIADLLEQILGQAPI